MLQGGGDFSQMYVLAKRLVLGMLVIVAAALIATAVIVVEVSWRARQTWIVFVHRKPPSRVAALFDPGNCTSRLPRTFAEQAGVCLENRELREWWNEGIRTYTMTGYNVDDDADHPSTTARITLISYNTIRLMLVLPAILLLAFLPYLGRSSPSRSAAPG